MGSWSIRVTAFFLFLSPAIALMRSHAIEKAEMTTRTENNGRDTNIQSGSHLDDSHALLRSFRKNIPAKALKLNQ